MPARNDVTGDRLISKANSTNYRDNWDNIFKKKEEIPVPQEDINKKSFSDFTAEMDRYLLDEILKDVHFQTFKEDVFEVFRKLKPELNLTEDDIGLIALMWEESKKPDNKDQIK